MTPGIRRIEIQNFKSIERAVVDLAPFTVLVGPNGAGKSNFVGTLAFLQQLVRTGIEQMLRFRPSELPRWLPPGQGRSFGLRVEMDLPAGLQAEYSIEIGFGPGDRAQVTRERRLTVDLVDAAAALDEPDTVEIRRDGPRVCLAFDPQVVAQEVLRRGGAIDGDLRAMQPQVVGGDGDIARRPPCHHDRPTTVCAHEPLAGAGHGGSTGPRPDDAAGQPHQPRRGPDAAPPRQMGL